jgi:hypothetical protein
VPPPTLSDRLAGFDTLVEVGVGRRPGLARELARRGARVTVTDVAPFDYGGSHGSGTVTFVVDDVTDPEMAVYTGVEAVYARRLPPELQRPTWRVARTVGCPLLFTTLGTDPVLVPSRPETLATGTVHVVESERA